jgi:hypothetical protein
MPSWKCHILAFIIFYNKQLKNINKEKQNIKTHKYIHIYI